MISPATRMPIYSSTGMLLNWLGGIRPKIMAKMVAARPRMHQK